MPRVDEFDEVKSSHISEALAAAMGFRTNAALKASLVGPEQDRPFALLHPERFLSRLVDFGYPLNPNDPEFDFELRYEKAGVVSTIPTSGYDIEYKSARSKAWRNLMVFTVNEALARKLLTLRLMTTASRPATAAALFDFSLPNGLPCVGTVRCRLWRVNVHAAVNPTGPLVRTINAEFSAGDAVARGWLERERGVWRKAPKTGFVAGRAAAGTGCDGGGAARVRRPWRASSSDSRGRPLWLISVGRRNWGQGVAGASAGRLNCPT
ncbi:MAG: hypothetical protein IPJ08_25130 [Burkholderiales bacterium]|nr:hypothetical protein [Burkholderiales bacterium]